MKRRALLTATAATAALCLNSCAQSVPPVELVDIPPLPLPAGATVGLLPAAQSKQATCWDPYVPMVTTFPRCASAAT